MKDNNFTIKFEKFFSGYAPAYFKNSLSSVGSSGMAVDMQNIDILDPNVITQGKGLSALTAGSQAGAVTDLIKYVLEKAVTDNKTYAISSTKLHELSSTAVTNTGNFPYTITNATDGQSIAILKGNLYAFYNKASGGDILKYDLASTFDPDWGSTVPTGAAALQKAPHPTATKEDLSIFGNGRYLGVYTDGGSLEPTKLDFGNDSEVSDVVFFGNQWWIAVNSPNLSGSNRSVGNLFLYDGSATSTILDDETGVGLQRIGFIKVMNGIIYLAYQDLTSIGGYKIGYVSGRRIVPIGYFTGSLPLFYQATLYENTILFLSGQKIFSNGAIVDDLPIQTSQIASARYETAGAISAPFGDVLVASGAGSNYSLDKFNDYTVTSNWTSIIIPIASGRNLGFIDEAIIYTESFASGGRVDITFQYNQNSSNSGVQTISTANKRRHIIKLNDRNIEDVRVYINYENGSSSIPVKIRAIELIGHYLEN